MDLAENLVTEAEHQVSARWQQRIIHHLAEAIDRDLRRDGPAPLPTSEQQAIAMMRTIAAELGAAVQALDWAAHALKEFGHGVAANRVHLAADRAREAQTGFVGKA